jgi:signal transduction histidine kinase
MSSNLPPLIERYLDEVLVRAAAPLVLSFARDWTLRAAYGDAAHYGLDSARPETGLAVVRDLFLGIAEDEAQAFAFVELPGGRSAHVHRVPEGDGFHVLLIDATADTARQRAVQQLGNQAEIASHEKSRALSKLKRVRTELEAQRAQLEEAVALKSAMLASLSHEFRTPLTSVFGYLHLLERRHAQDTASHAPLRAVRRAATHLFALSENLLEYARRDSGGSLVSAGPVDLNRLAEDIRDLFSAMAAEQKLAFAVRADITGGAPPISDELKLRQILINLVSNAVRYAAQGRVEVRVQWDGQRIGLHVEDTGVGIAPEYHEAIFEPFNRKLPRGSKGAGLGLSIVRGLAHKLGGSVRLDSAAGQGARFHVDLPSLPPDGLNAPAPAVAQLKPRRGGHALIADDDADVRMLVQAMLSELGYSVYPVGNANDAFQYAIAHNPDLVVVDVQMPGLSGNAAAYRLRAAGYRGRIIALSATPTAEARDASLAAGVDVYLTKPVNLDQLVNAVSV